MTTPDERSASDLRLGQAAELLGVTTDTLRRWETDGRLTTHRSSGGQRLVALADRLGLPSQMADRWCRDFPDAVAKGKG